MFEVILLRVDDCLILQAERASVASPFPPVARVERIPLYGTQEDCAAMTTCSQAADRAHEGFVHECMEESRIPP